MLKQVLKQNASKAEAKSNQSQRQILSPHLSVLGMRMESSTTSSSYVSAGARAAVSPSPVETRLDVVSASRQGWAA